MTDGKMAGQHVELAVTSALGRAISQLGGELSPDKRKASQTEMGKAERVALAAQDWPKLLEVADTREKCLTLLEDARRAKAGPAVMDMIITKGKTFSEKKAPAQKENKKAEAPAW